MKRLFVRPLHHGTGLGRRLATAVIDEARRAGYPAMKLDTLPSMKAAIGLYQSLGFRDTAPYTHNPIDGARFMESDPGAVHSEIRPARAPSPPAAAPATGGS